MSYVFFENILEELGHKLTYDAVVNYAGNSFCEKSWDIISDNNPLNIATGSKSSATMKTLVDMFNSADIKVMKKDEGEQIV